MYALLRRRRIGAALALLIAGVAAAPAQAQFPGGPAFPVTSTASGDWTSPNTWITGSGPGVPISSDLVTVSTGHNIELTGDVTVADLTLSNDSSLDLNGHTLTVEGLLTMTGSAGHAPELLSTGASGDVELSCLDTQHADFTNVDVDVVDAQSCTQTTILRPGATTWTTSTFSQTGGNATIATSLPGLSPTFNAASLRVLGHPVIGGTLTLTGTGPIAFLPGEADPTAMLAVGGLSVSGTHAVSVDWSGIDPLPNGTEVTLVTSPEGPALDALTASNTADTTFTRPAAAGGSRSLIARYFVQVPPVNSGAAPSVTVVTDANPGYAFAGEELTCNRGEWTDAESFDYRWWIDGSVELTSAPTYTHNAAATVTCTVTAQNEAGSTTARSAPVVVLQRIGNFEKPSIRSAAAPGGLAAVGEALPCDHGLWNGALGGFTYQWTRDGAPISGQTAATYTAGDADLGKSLGCTVTVSAAGVSVSEASAAVLVSREPAVTFSSPTTVAIARGATTASATVTYVPSDGTTVVSCTFRGTPLADCASGLQLTGLEAGLGPFSLTVTNADGWTREVGFNLDVTAAVLDNGKPDYIQNTPPPYDAGSAVPEGPSQASQTLPPVLAVVGGTVVRAMPNSAGLEEFNGDGVATKAESAIVVKPTKPGTFKVTWKEAGVAKSMAVYAHKPTDEARLAQPMGGVIEAKKPLTCPEAAPIFNRFVSSQQSKAFPGSALVAGDDAVFPAASLPKDGTVTCLMRAPASDEVVRADALVVGSKRFALDVQMETVVVFASGSAEAEVSLLNSKSKSTAKATDARVGKGKLSSGEPLLVPLKAGRNTIRIAKGLAAGQQVRLRVEVATAPAKKGKKTAPATWSKPLTAGLRVPRR